MTAAFPFNDLHSFKDYVRFVRMCAPASFPVREGLRHEDQWTTRLAFQGLRQGLSEATIEKGALSVLARCGELVDQAERSYEDGDRRTGFANLSEVMLLLKGIKTR